MASSTTRMLEIYDRIASPLAMSLLTTHPNQVTLDGRTPDLWSSWLGWAAGYDQELPKWQQLLSYYCRPTESPTESASLEISESIPAELRLLIDTVRNLQLSRESACAPVPAPHSPRIASKARGRSPSSFGMSPKKEHEVTRMATFIHNILNHDVHRRNTQHVVDVGSGQGYLSRALQEQGLHVLALDNNENQTSGANNWKIKDALRKAHEQRRNNTQDDQTCPSQRTPSSHSNGSLTHRTVHIQPTALEAVIEDWLLADVPDTITSSRDPTPIMFVALHACGSLTVDVLRTFLSHHSKPGSGHFPLSEPLLALSPRPTLPIAALHLATQVPAHWFRTERAGMGACLAVRKVVYRALLQPVIQLAAQYRKEPTDNQEIMNRDSVQGLTARLGLGETPENRRLGKLNDASYADWSTFLVSATTKLGIDIRDLTRRHSEGAALGDQLPPWILNHGNDSEREEGVFERLRMEGRLEVVHVLRCILGPLIESLILLDRCEWLRGVLGAVKGKPQVIEEGREKSQNGQMVVEMVNLFDQVTGSGRNVALVVSPA
ncbi:methyltransferase domain-containing protein [Pisolithus croceorrhizus]|nr:methyltransferase domain-containing protein [Pisolithus croceorrhizus]